MSSEPEVGAELMAAFDLTFELAARLSARMESGLASRGLNTSRAEVLFTLHGHRPMVQRELSQALHCTPRYVTALIDGLEADGWVRRERHPTDRRATVVRLTDQGGAAAARMHAERLAAASQLFGNVPQSHLKSFIAVARSVLAQLGKVDRDHA